MVTKTKTAKYHSRIPPNESNRERFKRIGQHRMTQLLRDVRLVGQLAGPGYQWDTNDAAAMRNTITEAVEIAFRRFEDRQPTKLEDTFKLV